MIPPEQKVVTGLSWVPGASRAPREGGKAALGQMRLQEQQNIGELVLLALISTLKQ